MNRYIRQTTLKGFGPEGQQKLADAKVLVVGAGGLGIPVVTYLNAMGVGTIGIVDGDTVSETNLHRQVLYGQKDIGKSKAAVAIGKLKSQNPNTTLIGYEVFLNRENALAIVAEYDVVVDASDNFPTRYLINDSCIISKKPFVYGALHGYEGQVSVFNYKNGPTYRCLFPTMPKPDEVPNCNEHGVLGIIPGIVGNLQALETVKVLVRLGEVLSGKLLLFNGLDQSYRSISFKPQPDNKAISELQDFYGWTDSCENIPTISAEELPDLLHENGQLIDVRTPSEYEAYHLAGSMHIPLGELGDRMEEIDFSRPVYLLCQSGRRSEIALQQLREARPNTPFFSILGGLNQYLATCS